MRFVPVSALPAWTDYVIGLYFEDVDMEADEFERLYDVAATGDRPNHPRLPAYLPLERVGGMPTTGELR